MSQTERKPIFHDVTLRDGNQALIRPWNSEEKELIFHKLIELGVDGIEVGFASASRMDFESCMKLASIAPENVFITSLSRAVRHEIKASWEAIQAAAKPRLHIVLPISPFAMEHILNLDEEAVLKRAVESVAYARELAGTKGQVQFSGEHFGDCIENLDFAVRIFQAVCDAGADVVNLPNTVERYRPSVFASMVAKVVEKMPEKATISVHAHNDLGMATATTVESFFAGAGQLEVTLNGLGERAGNTNLYEAACALHNCGVKTSLHMNRFHETAQMVSKMAEIPIPDKSPIVGSDVMSHRSGIHQDGAFKTRHMEKGAYRAVNGSLVGRKDEERIEFTSQSGRTAVLSILKDAGIDASVEDASRMVPLLKSMAEKFGHLSAVDIVNVFHGREKVDSAGDWINVDLCL